MINKKLIDWSHEQFSHLPWRNSKRSLYTTLVSEIMLQQTTVGTVLNKFDPFLKKYPTVKKLAAASEEEVCLAWEGLGYYRRARNLRKAAIAIVEEYGGSFPEAVEELMAIPGIGDYTANALIGIGRDEQALAIDANLERVIARFYGIKEFKGPKLQKAIKLAYEKGEILKEAKRFGFRDTHEALMDLGRIFCQAKRADCHICPLNKKCYAYNEVGSPLELPKVVEKKKEKHVLKLLRIFVETKQGTLGYVKKSNEWLSGQVEVPTFILETTDKKLAQYPKISFDISGIKALKTGITKYTIENYKLVLKMKDFDKLLKDQKLDNVYSYFEREKDHFSTASKKLMKTMT